MTTARKATPSEDPVECGGISPLGKPVKMAVMSIFGSKKNSGQKNFRVKKYFGSKNFSGLKKLNG